MFLQENTLIIDKSNLFLVDSFLIYNFVLRIFDVTNCISISPVSFNLFQFCSLSTSITISVDCAEKCFTTKRTPGTWRVCSRCNGSFAREYKSIGGSVHSRDARTTRGLCTYALLSPLVCPRHVEMEFIVAGFERRRVTRRSPR